MIETWMVGIILITVFLVVVAYYACSLPTVPSREEVERSEILAILRRIEAALSSDSSESHPSSGNASPDVPTQNPKDRHEEAN